MEIQFQKATREDVQEMIELCNECFTETTVLEYAFKVFERTAHDENQIYLIGRLDGKMVAHAKISVIETIYEDMNTYAIINHFCVKENYRRHKIATKMLEEITKISLNRNCQTIKLWSNNCRFAAHSCYLENGFIKNDAAFFSKKIA